MSILSKLLLTAVLVGASAFARADGIGWKNFITDGARGGVSNNSALSWIPNSSNPPDIAVNWATNQAWTKTGGLTTPAALGISTSRASVKQVVDSNGNWSQVAANVTAISNLGRSTEEARTNSIRNNTMVGAVAGTPGTAPTNWTLLQPGSGISAAIIAVGTSQGIDYIDIAVSGTSSGVIATTTQLLAMESPTQIAALTAQTWSQSGFMAIVSGTLGGTLSQSLTERTSGGALVVDHPASITPSASLTSISQIITLNGGATTAAIQPNLRWGVGSGVAVNFTLRIGWPQLELGASVTSPIKTTAGAATRAADVTTLSGLTYGSAFSLFSQFTPQAPIGYGTNQYILEISDGEDVNQRLVLFRGLTTELLQARYSFGGSNVYNTASVAAITQNAASKAAISAISGTQNAALNGTALTSGAGVGTIVPTIVTFGCQVATGAAQLNGLTAIDAIWLTQAVPSAQLQSMTQ